MTSAWPELDDLIRELADVSALPQAEREPSLSEATMAVSKASAELRRAGREGDVRHKTLSEDSEPPASS